MSTMSFDVSVAGMEIGDIGKETNLWLIGFLS